MLTSQTRSLVLQSGRRSLGLWVCASRVSEPGLLAAVRRNYGRMAGQVPWPDQQVNRIILSYLLLPIAAVYTALRERGRTEQEAADAVTRAALALIAGPEGLVLRPLVRTEAGRRLFMREVPRIVDAMPGPAWAVTWAERSDKRVAFDVTRCYALETLSLLDTAPATAAVCADDDAICSGLCPQIRWSRTGTLATGADRCDFCWELLPAGPGQGAPRRREPPAGGEQAPSVRQSPSR